MIVVIFRATMRAVDAEYLQVAARRRCDDSYSVEVAMVTRSDHHPG